MKKQGFKGAQEFSAMAERLLEATQRKMWKADEEKIKTLQKIYLEMEGSLEGDEEK